MDHLCGIHPATDLANYLLAENTVPPWTRHLRSLERDVRVLVHSAIDYSQDSQR